uniref:RdRp n=1 Tax=Beihai reo-like virus 1 TaxID=1922649 RepID=A0A1L3KNZ6_9VIRU|nr:RdRp [Beihai reo-like virus 1]
MLGLLFSSFIDYSWKLFSGCFPSQDAVELKIQYDILLYSSELGYCGEFLQYKDALEVASALMVPFGHEGLVLSPSSDLSSGKISNKRYGFVSKSDHEKWTKWVDEHPICKRAIDHYRTDSPHLFPTMAGLLRLFFSIPIYLFAPDTPALPKGSYSKASPHLESFKITEVHTKTGIPTSLEFEKMSSFKRAFNDTMDSISRYIPDIDPYRAFSASLTTNASGSGAPDVYLDDFISYVKSFYGASPSDERIIRSIFKTRKGEFALAMHSFYNPTQFLQMLRKPVYAGHREQLQRRRRFIAMVPTGHQVVHSFFAQAGKILAYVSPYISTGKVSGTVIDYGTLMQATGNPSCIVDSLDISGFDGSMDTALLHHFEAAVLQRYRNNTKPYFCARSGNATYTNPQNGACYERISSAVERLWIIENQSSMMLVAKADPADGVVVPYENDKIDYEATQYEKMTSNMIMSGMVATTTQGNAITGVVGRALHDLNHIDQHYDVKVAGDDISIVKSGFGLLVSDEDTEKKYESHIEQLGIFRTLGMKIDPNPLYNAGIFLQQLSINGCAASTIDRISMLDERPNIGWSSEVPTIFGVFREALGRVPLRSNLVYQMRSLWMLTSMTPLSRTAKAQDFLLKEDFITGRRWLIRPLASLNTNEAGPLPLPMMKDCDNKWHNPISPNILGGDTVWFVANKYILKRAKRELDIESYRMRFALGKETRRDKLARREGKLKNWYHEYIDWDYVKNKGWGQSWYLEKEGRMDSIKYFRRIQNPTIKTLSDIVIKADELFYLTSGDKLNAAKYARSLLQKGGIHVPGNLSLPTGIEDGAKDLIAKPSMDDAERNLVDIDMEKYLGKWTGSLSKLLPKYACSLTFDYELTDEELDHTWIRRVDRFPITPPSSDNRYEAFCNILGYPILEVGENGFRLANLVSSKWSGASLSDLLKLRNQVRNKPKPKVYADLVVTEMGLSGSVAGQMHKFLTQQSDRIVPAPHITPAFKSQPLTNMDYKSIYQRTVSRSLLFKHADLYGALALIVWSVDDTLVGKRLNFILPPGGINRIVRDGFS